MSDVIEQQEDISQKDKDILKKLQQYRDTIHSKIDEWTAEVYGSKFSYRPGQKEVILNIIDNWLGKSNNKEHNFVIEAPTGTGKSFIAMTVAGLLEKYAEMRGCILVSDLSLLDQYEKDIKKYFYDRDDYDCNWAIMKGRNTYICNRNKSRTYVNGVCKEIRPKRDPCSDCPYRAAKNAAIVSSVLLCTYSLWLLNHNNLPSCMYRQNDFVICDECHKIPNIVQTHCSLKITIDNKKYSDISLLDKICNVVKNDNYGLIDAKNNCCFLIDQIKIEEDPLKLYNLLDNYCTELEKFYNASERFDNITIDIENTKNVSEFISLTNKQNKNKIKDALDAFFLIKSSYNTFSLYLSLFKNPADESKKRSKKINESCSIDNIIKNPTKSEIIFNTLDESFLMGEGFQKHCKRKLYMSATVGDINMYCDDMKMSQPNIKNSTTKFIKMPHIFDYTNSPIYYIPYYKMSYAEKEKSLPEICKIVEDIINKCPTYKGIIQTGSYDIGYYLDMHVSPKVRSRLILYSDTPSKHTSLKEYKASYNKVLIGPSLVEGISLDDDLCRFIIIMKMPYMSLTDKYVAARLKAGYNAWYQNITALNIIQGVGRGVRNSHDWCYTYILDGCFSTLIKSTAPTFDSSFRNRLKLIK